MQSRDTVVAVFDDRDDAQDAINALRDAGFSADDISILARDRDTAGRLAETPAPRRRPARRPARWPAGCSAASPAGWSASAPWRSQALGRSSRRARSRRRSAARRSARPAAASSAR